MQSDQKSLFESLFLCSHYFESVYVSLLTFSYIFVLQYHGDSEINPGSRKLKKKLSICPWNLNSLTTHNFSKFTQLKAYNSIYKYDFIYLSETYLDFATLDSLLEIEDII